MGNFIWKSKIAPAPAVLSGTSTTHAQPPTIAQRGPRTRPATSAAAEPERLEAVRACRTGGEQQRDVATCTTSRVITIPQARLVVVKPAEESESQLVMTLITITCILLWQLTAVFHTIRSDDKFSITTAATAASYSTL